MLNWLFHKDKQKETDLSHLGMDVHAHIIPGIDDGVETLEQSVEMLTKMQSLGYKRVVATPHVMWDCYKNTPDTILHGLADIRLAAKQAGLTLKIDAAAEYFIDEHFVEMLNNGEQLLTLPGKRVLVELPYSTPLMNTSETLFHIIAKGYRPVLAHPERYTYFYADPAVYKKLCDQGCELQLNILSLGHYYGESVHKMAITLLKQGLITFIGTDSHRIQHLDLIDNCDKNKWLTSYPFQNKFLLQE